MARPIPVQGQQLWCVVTRRGPLDQLCKTNIRATLIMLTPLVLTLQHRVGALARAADMGKGTCRAKFAIPIEPVVLDAVVLRGCQHGAFRGPSCECLPHSLANVLVRPCGPPIAACSICLGASGQLSDECSIDWHILHHPSAPIAMPVKHCVYMLGSTLAHWVLALHAASWQKFWS